MLINDKDESFFKDNDVDFFATVVLPKFIYCPFFILPQLVEGTLVLLVSLSFHRD